MVNQENQIQVLKIVQLLSEIEVFVTKNEEKLFLANSESFLKLIHKNGLTELLDSECQATCSGKYKKQKSASQASYFSSFLASVQTNKTPSDQDKEQEEDDEEKLLPGKE